MGEDATDKVIGRLREAQPSGIFFVKEHVLPGLGVGQVVVDMPCAAGAVCKGLGHVGGDGPVLLGVLAGHHFEESVAVCRDQGVIVDEIDLILSVGVFVVRLVGIPTHPLYAVHHVPQIVHDIGDAFEVVASFAQSVHVVGVPDFNGAVAIPSDQKMLRLNAYVEDVAIGPQVGKHPLEVLAGAEHVGFVVHVQIAGEADHALGPRHQGVAIQVDSGQHVVGVGTLTHARKRPTGEPGTGVRHVIHVGSGDHLDLG